MRRLTQEQKDKIMQLHKEGKSIYDIAKEFGLKYSIVAYHINPEFREKVKASSARSWKQKKAKR